MDKGTIDAIADTVRAMCAALARVPPSQAFRHLFEPSVPTVTRLTRADAASTLLARHDRPASLLLDNAEDCFATLRAHRPHATVPNSAQTVCQGVRHRASR
jgi:hypothetical protein